MTTTPPARRRRHAALVLALTGTLLLAAPAAAQLDDIRDRIREVERDQDRTSQQHGKVDERIDGLHTDLDHTSADLEAADKKLRETTAKVEQARIDLAAAEEEVAAAEAEAERIAGELEVAYANEAKIEESLERNAADQEETRQAVGAIARESYKSGGLGNLSVTLEVLSGSGDPIGELSMARTVMRVQDNTLERLSTQQAESVAEQDRLAGVRRHIALLLAEAEANVVRTREAREAADRRRVELEELEKQQAAEKTALEQEKAKLEEQLAAAQSESDALEQQLAELARTKHGLQVEKKKEEQRIAEEERRRAAAEAAARRKAAEAEARRQAAAEAEARRQQEASERAARSKSSRSSAPAPAPAPPPPPPAPAPPPPPPPPPASNGPLVYPVNAPTSSEFGYRVHPVLGTGRLHAGLDFAAGCGTPVKAAASGTIIIADYNSSAGNKIVIDHGVLSGVNLTTSYLHLERYARTGGQVNQGEIIGYVGTTGLSTGCHLHFETRENGTAVNPRGWL
jgi:murein DD-endopeptidase MepM/ murein hydrolase activator NlpD